MRGFTKGPWAVFRAKNGNLLGIGEAKNGDGITDGSFGLWRSGKEKEANAHLIAAAPDMYEALRLLMLAYEKCNGISHPAFEAAEKVIAKAEGK